ncbi:MAG: D-alanyl-D-alanine carboxypeptidase [Clostridia bacterium]|nr:D-alanyl-D-alanine carboxypeptidase [Clostridia bacterium]
MKNKIMIFMLMFCCLLSIFYTNVSSIYAHETIDTVAKGMVVLEGNTNTILYNNNSDIQLPMASTTKIMTALICIENCNNLDEKIVVSDNSVGIEGTSIYLKYNEEITIRDLLYGLILASGNDCAVAIAIHIAGTEDDFVDLMNKKVHELNLQNTHFSNPHGLDEEGHYTSAYDLAIITSCAMKNDDFRDIVATKRHTIESTNVSEPRYLKHKNRLMFEDDNCIGVKTGFTDNAKRCLVSAYEYEGMMIISVVLNCQPMFEECDRLTNLVKDNYVMKQFINPYSYVSSIDVNSSDKNQVGLITIQGFKIPILKSELDCYSVEYDLPDTITAPVELNEPLGNVVVLYNNDVIYSDKLYSIEQLDNTDLKYQIDKIIQNWF